MVILKLSIIIQDAKKSHHLAWWNHLSVNLDLSKLTFIASRNFELIKQWFISCKLNLEIFKSFSYSIYNPDRETCIAVLNLSLCRIVCFKIYYWFFRIVLWRWVLSFGPAAGVHMPVLWEYGPHWLRSSGTCGCWTLRFILWSGEWLYLLYAPLLILLHKSRHNSWRITDKLTKPQNEWHSSSPTL